MADHQLNGQNQYIDYLQDGVDGFKNFLYGGEDANGNFYPKVDLSLWDQATMCGTCHVGGPMYEMDRLGKRLPQRTREDWGMTGLPMKLNPLTATSWENYSTTTGKDKSFVTMSPWMYPVYMGPGGMPVAGMERGGPMVVPNGWGPGNIEMANPNGGDKYLISTKQLMMPNVKETDCLFCHLKGYDNVMASVMTQAGSLSAAPATGAGLFDMFSLSPTYMGYDPKTGRTSFVRTSLTPMKPMLLAAGFDNFTSYEFVMLTPAVTDNIKGKPDSNNCHQCHATKTLKDFPEMFGVTGTSSGFLSSAPMVYDPAAGVGPLGKRMVNYDINAPFLPYGTPSKAITSANYMTSMMTGLSYLQAMGATPYNQAAMGTMEDGGMIIGGKNPGMTGPLYYAKSDGSADQNVLKKSTMPFPRAEWFKRGDAWQFGQDVHASLGCAGCHFTGNSTDKNQCDPGRGFDMASTVQDGLPRMLERVPQADEGKDLGQTIKAHDTRNTVKRCEFCHITRTDYNGNPIETFNAPNPDTLHAQYGLTAKVNQIVDQMNLHGTFGGKGVPRMTNFTSMDTETRVNGVATASNPGGSILGRGNHLDVMDCTVCHVNKVSMAVRSLDASSGMRYPAIVGTDPMKGMLGLFEDPTNGMNPAYGGQLQQWKPLNLWQAYGNMKLPLSTGLNPADDRFQFRRKIYLTNAITAILWNNEGETVDANGDGAKGGLLVGDNPATGLPDGHTKDSLTGYRDIFSGDVPDHNNTAGYDWPIFDPWIQKDLKSGMNFGAAPLSVISVGFGGELFTPEGKTDPTNGAYANLYNNGYFQGNSWKYASVWSGAVVFSEPDQIRGYKDFRTSIKDATDGKSWDQTALTLVGSPFMITHGVKPVNSYVLGKSCADCHAPGKGFFKGGFDMIGPAIPATGTYDPGQYPDLDLEGNVQVDDHGEVIRYQGQLGNIPGNMMARPLEPMRIKALPGDLRGFLETHNKLGQPREVNIVKPTVDGQFVYASTVDRSDALYPEHDGKIYFKISEISEDGNPVANATALLGSEYADYLEKEISGNLSAYGIGVEPKAAIVTPLKDDNSVQLGVQWINGTEYTVNAAFAQPDSATAPTKDTGTVTYAWSTPNNDALGNPVNSVTANATSRQGAKIKFTTLGTKTITLNVVDEEGKQSSISTTVTVIDAPIAISWDAPTDFATFSNLPAGTAKITVNWGDGLVSNQVAVTGSSATLKHVYATATQKTIKLYCYNATGKQLGYMQKIIIP